MKLSTIWLILCSLHIQLAAQQSVSLTDTLDMTGIRTLEITGLRGMQIRVSSSSTGKAHYSWTVSGTGKSFEDFVEGASVDVNQTGDQKSIRLSTISSSGDFSSNNESWLKSLIGPDKKNKNSNFARSIHQNFELFLPPGTSLRLFSSASDLELSGLEGALSVENRTGNVSARDILGDLSIVNRYGTIDTDQIKGNLTLENKSGKINITGVTGDLKASSEYSTFTIRDVEGSVYLSNKSGKTWISNVGGLVDVEAGYETLDVENVQGSVRIEGKSGTYTTRKTGPVRINANHSTMNVTEARGDSIIIRGRSSSVTAFDIEGSFRAHAEHGSVKLERISGVVQIYSDNSDVRIRRMQGRFELIGTSSKVDITGFAGTTLKVSTTEESVFIRDINSFDLIDITNSGSPVTVSFIKSPIAVFDLQAVQGRVIQGNSVSTPSARARVIVRTTGANIIIRP